MPKKRTKAQRQALFDEAWSRVDQITAETPWWWVSFSDDRFLGACIVQGHDVLVAIARADKLKIAPAGGGEALACEIPADVLADHFPPQYRNVYLDKETVMKYLAGQRVTTV